MSRIRVAVLFGGMSVEYNNSLISAYSIISALDENKYEVIPLGITKKGRWLYFPGSYEEILNDTWSKNADCTPAVILPDRCGHGIGKLEDDLCTLKRIDVVFPALHGKDGEDGKIQGLLALSRLAYVGCGVAASAACMDKSLLYSVLSGCGMHTPRCTEVYGSDLNDLEDRCEEIIDKLDFPMLVRPADHTQPMGIIRAENTFELPDAIRTAFSHGRHVLIEEAVTGTTLYVAVLGTEKPVISPAGEFSVDDKGGVVNTIIPSDIRAKSAEKIRHAALKAYTVLNCDGPALMRFTLTEGGRVIVNDVRTMPGMTPSSIYPTLMQSLGITYQSLIDRLITMAVAN